MSRCFAYIPAVTNKNTHGGRCRGRATVSGGFVRDRAGFGSMLLTSILSLIRGTRGK